jgi:dipeptidyl aminopeptidase/acylaminoacyl peptidase
MNRFVRRLASLLVLCFASAGAEESYRLPPQPMIELVDAPATPAVLLSPDRRDLLLLEPAELPTIAELAQPELRLAGLRINPVVNGPSRTVNYTGFVVKAVDGAAERRISGLPAGAHVTHRAWSRRGAHLALAVIRENGIELWIADRATAQARRVTPPILNAVFGEPFAWLDESTLVIRRVPADRGAAPRASQIPAGPVVQETLGRRAAARTFEDLLANTHDEALFDHYATAELALVSLDGSLAALPVRGVITSVMASPDGRHLLVESVHRPYSYLVPASRFPLRIEVFDRAGRHECRVADLPLREGIAEGAVRPGPRSVSWRADQPATLSWVRALERSEAGAKPTRRDIWFTQAAPFDGKPVEQQRFEFRVQGIDWGDDTLALVTESWTATRRIRTWRVTPGRPGAAPELLFDRSTEDRYRDPGRPVLGRNRFGRLVLQRSTDGARLFFSGVGASPEGSRPFLDEFDLANKRPRRIWQSEPPAYEEFVVFADAALTRAITRRESESAPPNFHVRDLRNGDLTPITAFPHPYPQFATVKKELIRYRRADGVALSGTLYLPPGYTPASGPRPALIWAYPREFLSAEAAGQIATSPHRFARISATGPLPLLLAGYVVLADPAMPIVGRDGRPPNDTYLQQLVANAQAAIDELVRRGVADRQRIAVGGHSYGAFMTANLLAHSNLFRAGIARSGAYNRSLTPFGFQHETRSFWQAPTVYAAMSPFNYADKIKAPLLLVHGEADNNSGTFPLQSERFYHALKGHGANARFVLLPHESHAYRARESILHLLWETTTWLDTHVKHARPAAPAR